jgi:2-hydroxy-6-oxonona-2,4-dienedioate hydrolase
MNALPLAGPDPLLTYRSFWLEMMHRPYQLGWVDAGGIQTRYLEAGDPSKPTVVMLHGIGGSVELFIRNIGPLSDHFHVLALDLVGFGLTDKADHDLQIDDYVAHLEAFLDAKGLTSISFVAISLGTWVSAAFTDRHPDRVDKLVLIAPAGLLAPPDEAATFSQQQAYETVDDPNWQRLNLTFDHLVYEASSKWPDLLAVRRAVSLDSTMPASTRRIMSLLDGDVTKANLLGENVYRRIANPVLLIECPDTVDLSFHMIQRLKTLIADHEVLSVPQTAHWPNFEAPDIVNPAAIAFLSAPPRRN